VVYADHTKPYPRTENVYTVAQVARTALEQIQKS
jgi:hypothetical protein